MKPADTPTSTERGSRASAGSSATHERRPAPSRATATSGLQPALGTLVVSTDQDAPEGADLRSSTGLLTRNTGSAFCIAPDGQSRVATGRLAGRLARTRSRFRVRAVAFVAALEQVGGSYGPT